MSATTRERNLRRRAAALGLTVRKLTAGAAAGSFSIHDHRSGRQLAYALDEAQALAWVEAYRQFITTAQGRASA